MKMLNRLFSAALVGVALLGAGAAQAATWTWSYSGTGVTASGTFTTAGNAASLEDLLSLTGTRNGTSILGLVPLESDDNYVYDNQFTTATPHLTDGGWLYDIGGSGPDAHINIYFDPADGQYHDLRLLPDESGIVDTIVTFNVVAVPVPEASTLGYMALGMMSVGFVARRRSKAT